MRGPGETVVSRSFVDAEKKKEKGYQKSSRTNGTRQQLRHLRGKQDDQKGGYRTKKRDFYCLIERGAFEKGLRTRGKEQRGLPLLTIRKGG